MSDTTAPSPPPASAMGSICAVVVTYHPDPKVLGELLAAALPQVEHVALVDNGSPQHLLAAWVDHPRITIVPLGENLGVAAAQNAGISVAKGHGAEYVLLLDHDSIPTPGMVPLLRAAHDALTRQGRRVAAVGPHAPKPHTTVNHAEVLAPMPYLGGSGSLIRLSTLEAVGPMHAPLFVDYIDIEWSLRAGAAGYGCFGVAGAVLKHAPGDPPIRILGREVSARSPLRHYYLFRNAIWLYRQPHIPLRWKLADGARLARRFAVYALFGSPRLAHVKAMLAGVLDGLRGRLGPKR